MRNSRLYSNTRYVYTVISQRARGLSIGINLNPDKACNFDCLYCEIDRNLKGSNSRIDISELRAELERTILLAATEQIRGFAPYQSVPADLLKLQEVALSGDGEPTLSPQFNEVVETAVHLRAASDLPFFKIVLITNATGLDSPAVQEGLKLFTSADEIWAKIDAGSQNYFQQINQPGDLCELSLARILQNILALAKVRPVIIQSLFCAVDGIGPSEVEIEAYAQRLAVLKAGGAQIPLVQIYSAHRPAIRRNVTHLPLKVLSQIAQRVRQVSGLKAEVF
jgi:wyosine [tRNA(Phe)-imidazoG37] synthetase (radical SAM superfamily)